MSEKFHISLRYWLLGKDYTLALKAMEYASQFHTGLRRDGKTPEFNHQLSIASYIRTLIDGVVYPQETLAAAFLHDVCEDYDVGFEEINAKFGTTISSAVKLLTKKHRGNKTSPETYYAEIAGNPIASIVKGADRINNIQTMPEVFTALKQSEYISETENLVLPMLKKARREFLEQERVYENIKLVLRSQIDLLNATLKQNKVLIG